MTTPNCNDGSDRPPRLRLDLNFGTVGELPAFSQGPVGDQRTILVAAKAAGYEGSQGGDPALSRELGLRHTSGARVNKPGEIGPLAERWKAEGQDCATLHVAWGIESDAEVDALVREIIAVSRDTGVPLFIETHRATITQDLWRTVRLVERHPGVRFNGDFSHWYTGLEMPYGDFLAKLEFAAPALERVRFMHGRLGNSSHMQMPLDHPSMPAAIEHFREMWTRALLGFLRSAAPGDVFCFAPELLAGRYAPTVRQADGGYSEQSDRWLDALELCRLATGCFAEAQRRLGPPASRT